MRLGKILIAEIALATMALLVIMVVVGNIPYLESSKQNASIELYHERESAKGKVTLGIGETVNVRFNYSSYDPAIIILELSFQTCEEPGYLILYCNYRRVASIFVRPETPPLFLNLISVSGWDWVEPPSAMFGMNEFLFESESQNGYVGNLSYRITLRGSR